MNDMTKRFSIRQLLLTLAVLLFLASAAAGVYFLSGNIRQEIQASSENSLRELLDVITQHTDEMFRRDEVALHRWADFCSDFRAEEIPGLLQHIRKDAQIAALAFVPAGEREGLTSAGTVFYPVLHDFSGGRTVGTSRMSEPYMGSVGAWCYAIQTEIVRDGTVLGTLYGEFIYDNFQDMIPQEFYGGDGVIYLMDAESRRFMVHPHNLAGTKGGNRNLEFFLAYNAVTDDPLLLQINEGLDEGDRMMIRLMLVGKDSYMYFWPTTEGRHYLVGFVPEDSISRVSDSVSLTIQFMIGLLVVMFLSLLTAYALYQRYTGRLRAEHAREQAQNMRQLKEALALAESASRSKSTFLSNMSHDIRTPMNAIIGFSTLLMRDAEDPQKVREYTRKVASSSQHLLGLINDVLDMSKIESGKMVLSISEFEMADIVSAADTVIRPQAEARRQTLEVSVSGLQYERLLGDETRLNQILINLLSNAVKYTGEGGHIVFRIRGLPAPAHYQGMQITVADDGYGMTPEFQEHIFDAFSRAENSTTNKVQGTGLGMAITRSTVELMGGSIHVDSESGKGSTFTVRLELRVPEEADDTRFWVENGIFRLLAVSGEPETCENIRGLMEPTGVRTDTAPDGAQAVRLAREAADSGAAYDAALLDWSLPDAADTARALQGTRLLALVDSDWIGIAPEVQEAGVFAFLIKPFFVANLKAQIGAMRGGTPQGPEVSDALAGSRFLVAEDNELNSEILGELLQMQEASCDIVENGQLALEAFRNSAPGQYDAILMDVQMPVMNGYEAARAIRALDRPDAAGIPIVAMTANAFTEDVAEAMEAGMNAHVAKPVDVALLNATLIDIVKKKGKRNEA